MNVHQRLIFRFFRLSWADAVRIAYDLGLVEPGDDTMTDAQRLQAIYRRAKRGCKLNELWRCVEACYADGKPDDNPFEQQEEVAKGVTG